MCINIRGTVRTSQDSTASSKTIHTRGDTFPASKVNVLILKKKKEKKDSNKKAII